MRSITPDMTALSQYGLTPDHILNGEKSEFDPEAKLNPRKEKYVRHEFAAKLCDSYNADLLDAYRVIEELERENDRLKADLAEASSAVETSSKQVRQMLKGEKEFADAEKLLAKFEQQMESLAKDKKMDKTTIQQLTNQVRELEVLRDTVPQLEADVNEVLANLRSYFLEEGIPMPDEDGYDGPYDDDYPE